MTTTTEQIAQEFSKGNFSATYPHFNDGITWHIIGDRKISGKSNVIEFCDKMLAEIAGSVLNNTNIVAGNNTIAIEGYCHFNDAEGKAMQVQYCDVYTFQSGTIATITSYCISSAVMA